jgi:hypothetical protein
MAITMGFKLQVFSINSTQQKMAKKQPDEATKK